MNPADGEARHAAMTPLDTEVLRRQLVDMGDGLQAQLHELSARPRVDACDRLLINLSGAQQAVRRFREALVREGGNDGTQTER